MDWIELIIHTTTQGADFVSGLLMEYGASGTMVEDRADIPDPSHPHGIWEIIDPKLLENMPEDVLVHAWFRPEDLPALLDQLESRLAPVRSRTPEFGSLRLDTRSVRDEDWAEVWKKYYKPFHLSERLVVKPSWEAYEPAADEMIIEMDPGMAFGSGTHETTDLCANLLEETIRGGESLLDVGTGSGILAIAAALLGASPILAIDIDPDAVRIARENVLHNHVDQVVTVQEGNLLDRAEGVQCDICVLNIISDVVIFIAKDLLQHIRPGGFFICSGIVDTRRAEVRQALEAAGYQDIEEVHRGEWTAFRCRR